MKKIIALILVVALLCPMVACAAEEKQNEIYVMYKDGSDGILSYSSEAEAQNAIAELSVTISEGESRQRTRRSGRGQMPFGGGFTEAEEELIRELTDRMLREFFR